jgi:hypothetical protein
MAVSAVQPRVVNCASAFGPLPQYWTYRANCTPRKSQHHQADLRNVGNASHANLSAGERLAQSPLPLLVALVAVLGSARWLRTILVLAITALLLLVAGVVALRAPWLRVGDVSSMSTFVYMQAFAISAINCSGIISGVGVILALFLTARTRQWTWFTVLLVAAAISTVAGMFVSSFAGIYTFIGFTQAQTLFTTPVYAIITTLLASLRIVAMLVYALLRSQAIAEA